MGEISSTIKSKREGELDMELPRLSLYITSDGQGYPNLFLFDQDYNYKLKPNRRKA